MLGTRETRSCLTQGTNNNSVSSRTIRIHLPAPTLHSARTATSVTILVKVCAN